jgi:hypothetical protein
MWRFVWWPGRLTGWQRPPSSSYTQPHRASDGTSGLVWHHPARLRNRLILKWIQRAVGAKSGAISGTREATQFDGVTRRPWASARWEESLRQRAGIHPHSPVPLLDSLLAPFRPADAGYPERGAVALALAAPGRPGGENDLPNSSQYGDSSHPQSRMRAVGGASDLALHLWAILGSNQ